MQTLDAGVTGRGGARKLLPTRAVMARYGISDRTIDRWLIDPRLNFPRPKMIRNRRYFHEDELDAFDASRA